jgi:hypothetical protein
LPADAAIEMSSKNDSGSIISRRPVETPSQRGSPRKRRGPSSRGEGRRIRNAAESTQFPCKLTVRKDMVLMWFYSPLSVNRRCFYLVGQFCRHRERFGTTSPTSHFLPTRFRISNVIGET